MPASLRLFLGLSLCSSQSSVADAVLSCLATSARDLGHDPGEINGSSAANPVRVPALPAQGHFTAAVALFPDVPRLSLAQFRTCVAREGQISSLPPARVREDSPLSSLEIDAQPGVHEASLRFSCLASLRFSCRSATSKTAQYLLSESNERSQ